MLALRLPADIEQRLEELARKTRRTKSFYARQAIQEYLDDLEEAYLSELRLCENPEFDEAMAELGLDAESASR